MIVTRAGPASFAGWNPALNDPTSTTTYAIGRYAYAVYDEGGLLDINVAGYPTSTDPTIPSVTDIGRKGVLAFADLTALPIDVTAGTFMSRAAINKFILFRNYGTMGSTSIFSDFPPSDPNFTPFTPSQALAFVNYYLGNPQIGTSQDFGQVNGVYAPGSIRTDQSFINRAELINFVKSTGIANVNTLQYLGTFSRERNHSTVNTSAGNSLTLLANRFPLSRFELFASTPPTDPTAVQQRFGLLYVPASGSPPTPGHWRYVGKSRGAALLPGNTSGHRHQPGS